MKKCWLDKKAFVITGASSGLGKGIAEKLIKNHGCTVYAIGRSEEKLRAFSEQLGDSASLFIPVKMDVSDSAAWEAFTNELKTSGKSVDGLINCAGIFPPFNRTLNVPEDTFRQVMEVDYFACIKAINALYPILSASPCPAIINVGSASSLATIVGTSAYSAAKSAIKAYTEALIYEQKGKAYVALVMPGFARTEIFRSQNSTIDSNKLFVMMSMPAERMVNKIYRGIKRKRTRMVLGADAKAMCFFYRLFPRLTMAAIKGVLKKSNMKLFEDVFK